MKVIRSTLIAVLSAAAIDAFAFKPRNVVTTSSIHSMLQQSKLTPSNKVSQISSRQRSLTQLYSKDDDEDDEIARLKSMAAQLRSEAAKLEAEKAEAMAQAALKAFQSFDTNNDGEVSLAELKAGLEKNFKMELSEKRVKQLMTAFDESGDGALQLDEFVTVDKFRNKLEALVREEKELAAQAEKEAKLAEEAKALAEARLNFLNEKPPTNLDKIYSVLPYLFPLMDGLQYGRFLIMEEQNNPIVIALALLYALYRSIPFSGFAAFFALNLLANNPSLNRLVRFNMQQAIFLDIALFLPGLISGVYTLILKGIGSAPVPGVSEIFSDVIFGVLLISITYCTISSLFGITPDKLPIISDNVKIGRAHV